MKRERTKRRKKEGKATPRSSLATLPGWAPYALFGLLTVVLFREFIVSGDMLFGTDVVALGYFARKLYVELIRDFGVFPFWNPYIFSGLPFVDAMHGDIFYPTTVLKFVMPVHRAMGWKIVLHVFLAGVVTFAWLRHLKLSKAVAMFGGATYMLAPVLVSLIYPGHDGKLFVTALTPLALWVTDSAVTRGGFWRFGLLSLTVALLIFTAHMQLAYFATWAVGALALFRLAQARSEGATAGRVAGRLGALLVAGIVGGLGIGAIQLWTPIQYLTKYSQRVEKTTEAEAETGYAYSTSWSLHPEEAVSLVVPEFIGGNLQSDDGPVNTYWGRNPFKLNHEYGGLIPLILVPIAFLGRRRRAEVWLFTGIAAAALVYALGATTPLFRLFYALIPGVKLFRAPSSIMFIFAIATVTAGALGLEATRQRGEGGGDDWEEFGERVRTYLWVVAGFFLFLALLGSVEILTKAWTSTLYRGITPPKMAALEGNLPNIKRGLWLSAGFVTALAMAWHLRVRGSIKESAWLGLVIAISIADVWRVDGAYVRVVNPDELFPRDDTIDYLIRQQQSSPPFRVLALPNAPYQQNHFAFYGLEEVTGHHGNELGRYRDLTEGDRLVQQGLRVLRLLNVRYLISGAALQAGGLREAHRGRRSVVYEIAGTFPRAFVVSGYHTAPDSLAIGVLLSEEFDPARAAVLDEIPEARPNPGAQAQVEWLERSVNASSLRVQASGPVLLVVSENYYPAWRATLDGEPTPVLRGDYTLRAVSVPAGAHVVRFEYHSTLFTASAFTTLISGLLVLGLVAGALISRRRRASAATGTAPAE